MLIAILGAFLSGFSASYAEPDEKTAKELKLLEGVWADEPPKGDRRRNVVRFIDGKMGWQSTRYRGGEPLAGTTEGFEVQIDASAKPKLITQTKGDDKHKETLLGIYEIEGARLVWGSGFGACPRRVGRLAIQMTDAVGQCRTTGSGLARTPAA
jgi:hypothetical protein